MIVRYGDQEVSCRVRQTEAVTGRIRIHVYPNGDVEIEAPSDKESGKIEVKLTLSGLISDLVVTIHVSWKPSCDESPGCDGDNAGDRDDTAGGLVTSDFTMDVSWIKISAR